MRSRTYPSDLTDFEWDVVKGMIPKAKRGGRKRTVDIRQIINAIFYVTDNGIKWRSVPKEYPHWETVYGYFKQWTNDQTIEKIHRKLRTINRVIKGKKPDETVSIIDSQTVKGTEEGRKRGYDAGKKQREESGMHDHWRKYFCHACLHLCKLISYKHELQRDNYY